MKNFMLNALECEKLIAMISKAENETGNTTYDYDPGFTIYACSCTAHKKSCGWD